MKPKALKTYKATIDGQDIIVHVYPSVDANREDIDESLQEDSEFDEFYSYDEVDTVIKNLLENGLNDEKN